MFLKKEFVSVIIPVFNAERFIERTINSVLSQSYNYFETLVLDDGSTDGTASIVKNIVNKDKRVRYFSQSNQGLAYSRNRLCKMASGEYIAFLDHDDEWLPEKLKIQLDLFRKKRDCALIYGNVLNVYAKDNKESFTNFTNRRPHRGRVFYQFLIEGNFVPQPSMVIRTEVLRQYLPFKSGFKIAVDWELLLRLAREHSFDYVDEVVAVYNLHSERSSVKNALLEVEEILKIMDEWYRKDPKLPLAYLRQFLRAKAKINLQKTYIYPINQNYKKRVNELVKCLWIDPTWLKPYLKLIMESLLIIASPFMKLLGTKSKTAEV
ncbi:glycosyltransferase [Candidatus Omnitrophota bacterium]